MALKDIQDRVDSLSVDDFPGVAPGLAVVMILQLQIMAGIYREIDAISYHYRRSADESKPKSKRR